MKCESHVFGCGCDHEAKWIVEGRCVKRHRTCDYHRKLWEQRSYNDIVFMPLVPAKEARLMQETALATMEAMRDDLQRMAETRTIDTDTVALAAIHYVLMQLALKGEIE